MPALGFENILGNEELTGHLRKAVRTGRVGHAYLITGEPGSGRKMIAEAFAAALLCERHGDDACGTCSACKRVASGSHPDLIWVRHEKPNVITVDEIRSQIVNTVDIRPYEDGRKIYICPDAEKMNPQAQNALLKTIEEPPEYAVIILTAQGTEGLLPTILSRCTHLATRPVPDKAVRQYLMDTFRFPDYEAGVYTAFSQGNIGRAREAASDAAFDDMLGRTLQLVRQAHDMSTAEISERARELKDSKDKIDDILDICLMYVRDVLYYKATADPDSLIFTREISSIRKNAAASSYEGLQEILSAIDKCRVRIRANVNFELALELLLLTIKENLES